MLDLTGRMDHPKEHHPVMDRETGRLSPDPLGRLRSGSPASSKLSYGKVGGSTDTSTFPYSIAEELMMAESKGAYFNEHIRDFFAYEEDEAELTPIGLGILGLDRRQLTGRSSTLFFSISPSQVS